MGSSMKIKIFFLISLFSFSFIACGSPDKQLLDGIEKNDVKLVQNAIAKSVNVDVLNSEGYTPLMLSIMKNADTEIIKLLLEKGASPNAKMTIKEEKKEKETTPLFYVADSANVELTKLLLNYGGDPNIKLSPDAILTKVIYKYARTADKNYLTIANILLENGADPNIKSGKEGLCPMFAAMMSDKENETFELVNLLLSYGADPNVEFAGVSPLDGAIQQNYIKVMKLLLDNKANINIETNLAHPGLEGKRVKNLSPLGVAIVSGNLEAVKLLLKNGADINIVSTLYNDKTKFQTSGPALFLAIPYENKDVIRLLLNYGADVNATGMIGEEKLSVLSFAIGTKDLEIIKMLINSGAIINREVIQTANVVGDKNIINFFESLNKEKIIKNTETLFNAIIQSDVLLAKKSIQDAFINAEFRGNTPIMIAVTTKNKEMVKLLLDNGANINIKNKIDGYTPLILAVRVGDIKIAKLLLDHCADINIKDDEGKTAIRTAEYYRIGNNMVHLLEEYGAKSTQQVNNELFSAVNQGNSELVKKAIFDGADVNAKIKNSTVLHIVGRSGNMEIAKILIANKADINMEVKDGITPLMVASYYGNIDIVKLFLDNGAKIGIVAKNGDSALSVAQDKGHQDIVNLLKSKNQFKNSLLGEMKRQGFLNKTNY